MGGELVEHWCLPEPAPMTLHLNNPHVYLPAGAQLREWYLGGTASGQMEATATLRLYNVTAQATAAGLAASFVQELPEGRDAAELELIFAAGAVFGNGGMR